MNRIKEFCFKLMDAWFSCAIGTETILETAESGEARIMCLVNQKPQCIDITGKEDMIVNALMACNIDSWNQKAYVNSDVLDGFMWEFRMAYDDKTIISQGMNGYPKEFKAFLRVLSREIGMAQSEIHKSISHMENKDITYTKTLDIKSNDCAWSVYL